MTIRVQMLKVNKEAVTQIQIQTTALLFRKAKCRLIELLNCNFYIKSLDLVHQIDYNVLVQ